ncbi:phosphomevalonate kinase-like [Convolutriloba macropyga]|uniref:phosphomevalonate kinase-like n=1 Tax=Convolutriloba macropyga TaxID=536237 RepID=UPI003F527A07
MPKFIVVLSGKRKCGKDYLKDSLVSYYSNSSVLTLSAPLKKQYAIDHGLDYELLLGSSDYKERYREDMIRWGEQKRSEDPSFFCDLVVNTIPAKDRHDETNIWIVSDARRPSDIDYFVRNYGREKCILIRVSASHETRMSRGFEFQPGIDDADSECALDSFANWDLLFSNNDQNDFENSWAELTSLVS